MFAHLGLAGYIHIQETSSVMTNQMTFTRGDRRIDLDTSQSYKVEQFGRMFSLEPSSVWLKRNFDQRVYFPSADGRFDRLSEFDILNVKGKPANSTQHP